MKIKEEFIPTNKQNWRTWLEKNHETKDSVWLIFYKKNSPKYNLSWSDSVDEALCFGWIDSTKKSIDKESFKQYFTKRKPKSNWSKVNKDKVELLIDNGLMRKAGLKSIEIAKENGSWTFLDDVENLIVPDDLKTALESKTGAFEFYQGLSNSVKKMFLYWIKSAKREETRENRIQEIVEDAADGMIPKRFR